MQWTLLDIKFLLLNYLCRWVVRRRITQGMSIFFPRLFKPLTKLLFKKVIAIYARVWESSSSVPSLSTLKSCLAVLPADKDVSFSSWLLMRFTVFFVYEAVSVLVSKHSWLLCPYFEIIEISLIFIVLIIFSPWLELGLNPQTQVPRTSSVQTAYHTV